MTDANASLFWIIWFRTLQGALAAAPTLLCGLIIAGLIRGMIGPVAVRSWFTDNPRVGPVRAWLTGVLLPVCSLGVLPIAWELRRCGVPRATLLAFLLAAPLVDPFSLIYAFARLETLGLWGLAALILLLLGSFVSSAGTGFTVGLWLRSTSIAEHVPMLPASPVRRIAIAGLTAARGLSGALLPFVILGLLGNGLLGVIRGGALEQTIHDSSWAAPLRLSLISIPFYIPPANGMIEACDLLKSGTSFGKVLVIFLLGLGMTLGTFAWIAWNCGFRAFLGTFALVTAIGIGCGYALPFPLPGTSTNTAQPHSLLEIEAGGTGKTARLRSVRTTVTNEMGQRQWFHIGACVVLAGLSLIGLFSRALGQAGSPDRWMTGSAAAVPPPTDSLWSRTLSTPQISLAVALTGLVGVLAGMLVYYPSPDDLLNQIDEVQLELGETLKEDPVSRSTALRQLNQLQKLQRKLVVADLLRQWTINGELRSTSEELNRSLERLSVAVAERQAAEELNALYRESRQSVTRCSAALDDRRNQ